MAGWWWSWEYDHYHNDDVDDDDAIDAVNDDVNDNDDIDDVNDDTVDCRVVIFDQYTKPWIEDHRMFVFAAHILVMFKQFLKSFVNYKIY